jgi:hypothetical protein
VNLIDLAFSAEQAMGILIKLSTEDIAMDDWKSKIDRWQNAEENRRKQRQLIAEEKKRRKEEIQLAKHKKKFKCNICRIPSLGPVAVSDNSGGEYGIPAYEIFRYYKWDKPTGLARCHRCRKWTCEEHIYEGICMKCAAKL